MNAQALAALDASIVPGTGLTWAQWSQTHEAQSLSARDQHNALIRQMNIVNGDDPERGITQGGDGFFQQIPGQSSGETLGTRLAGTAVMGGYVAPALLAGEGGGAAAGGAEAGATTAAGSTAAGLTGLKAIAAKYGLSKLADVLGGASSAANQNNQKEDQLAAELAPVQLARDKFATAAPGQRLRDALRAALSEHATPASVSWGGPGSGVKGQLPVRSGGVLSLDAALQDPTYKQQAGLTAADLLKQEQEGGATGGGRDSSLQLPNSFNNPSLLDKVLGGSAFGSSLLAALGRPGGGQPSSQTPPTTVGPWEDTPPDYMPGADPNMPDPYAGQDPWEGIG